MVARVVVASLVALVVVGCGSGDDRSSPEAAAKTFLTGWAPELWLFALGALFVAATLLFPKGLIGLAGGLRRPEPNRIEDARRQPA